MKLSTCLSDFFRLFDLFSLTQFLRYNKDEDYTTVSGGITSLLVILIFSILFADNAITTIRKSQVTWSATKESSFQPTPVNVTFGGHSKSMFAIGIFGLNLNDPNGRYFDFDMEYYSVNNQTFTVERTLSLQPCTIEHFSMTETIKNNFKQIGAARKMCVPLNQSFEIAGKVSNNYRKAIVLRVKKCSASANSSIPCVNQTVIDSRLAQSGSFMANFYYVNPLINPGNLDYLDYEVNDLNTLSFNMITGTTGQAILKSTLLKLTKAFCHFLLLVFNQDYLFLISFKKCKFKSEVMSTPILTYQNRVQQNR